MGPRTVYAVLDEAVEAYGKAIALRQPTGKGQYRTWTWPEYRDAAREIACGLRRFGVRKGENVALYSETHAEFYLADVGTMSSGAVAAALYTSYAPPELVKNLRASDANVVFVENPKAMDLLMDAAAGDPLRVRWILLTGEREGVMTLDRLRESGRLALAEDDSAFDKIQSEFTAQDHAILYTTSGATGEPKMAFASHAAIVANLDMTPEKLPLLPTDSTIAFLPSAHIAQRIVIELIPIHRGVEVWFSESLAKLPNEMKSIRPTFLLAPPRVWERIFASISAEIRKRGAVTRKMFHGAVGLGAKANELKQAGKPLPRWMKRMLKMADRLVFSKIRNRLGGRIRIAISGAAPLGKELAEFYAAIGMPLVEGYGLTEGGIVTLNPLDRPKPGSIGKALPGMEVRLAEDGELLVKGPSLFAGYYKDVESTAAVLRDGWLFTGDIAQIDAEGYITITGRKKELIVSSNGKKIYPSRIEGLFKTEPLINQVLLIGDRLPYLTALFTLNAETLKGMEEFRGRSATEIAQAPALVAEVQKAVTKANMHLAPFEQIRRFRVMDRDFTIEHGEVTPTMKVRRNKVLENHREMIRELYLGREPGAGSQESGYPVI
jgi:long-chain acyl-CoA synthetase